MLHALRRLFGDTERKVWLGLSGATSTFLRSDGTEATPSVSGGVVGATFDGGGEALTLTDTTKQAVVAIASGNFNRVRVITIGGTGSVTLGVKTCALANYPGSLADVTGGNDVVISSNDTLDDSTLTGWTTTVTAGDAVEFELKAVSVFEQVTIHLEYA